MVWTICVLWFERCLSRVGEKLAICQRDQIFHNINLAPSKFHEIWLSNNLCCDWFCGKFARKFVQVNLATICVVELINLDELCHLFFKCMMALYVNVAVEWHYDNIRFECTLWRQHQRMPNENSLDKLHGTRVIQIIHRTQAHLNNTMVFMRECMILTIIAPK